MVILTAVATGSSAGAATVPVYALQPEARLRELCLASRSSSLFARQKLHDLSRSPSVPSRERHDRVHGWAAEGSCWALHWSSGSRWGAPPRRSGAAARSRRKSLRIVPQARHRGNRLSVRRQPAKSTNSARWIAGVAERTRHAAAERYRNRP